MITIVLGIVLALMAVGSLIAALTIKKRSWTLLAFASFGAFLWLSLGTSPWVFVLLALAGIFFVLAFVGWKVFCLILAIAAVVLAMALSVSVVVSHTQTTQQSSKTGNPAVDLTVKKGMMLPSAAYCPNDDRFSENSLKPVGPKGRTYADSDSTPFTPGSPAAQFTQYTSENCVNMTTTDAAIQALSVAPKIGNFSIYKANKQWMDTFMIKTAKSPIGLGIWLTQKLDKNGKIILDANGHPARFVTAEFQRYAEMVNTILLGLDNQGVKTARSAINWPSPGTLAAGVLPRVFEVTAPSKQESYPFLALTFTTKAGEACPFVLGIDVLDKRPELFNCPTARVIAPKAITQPQRQEKKEKAASPAAPAPASVTPSRNVTPQAPATPVAPKPLSTTPPTTTTTTPPAPPTTTPPAPPTPTTPSTPPPETCTWTNGSVHELNNGLCPKDASVIPSNPYHTPAAAPSGPASQPTHPAHAADPTVKPHSPSTQQAPGATPTPTPTASVPPAEVSNGPTNPATGCVNPVTGGAC